MGYGYVKSVLAALRFRSLNSSNKFYVLLTFPTLDFLAISENLKKLQESLLSDLSKICASPLSVITGFADLVKDGHLGAVNNQQSIYLERIISEAHSITQHLNHRLQLTLYQDINKVDLTSVDLSVVVAQCLKNVKPLTQDKEVTLKVNILSDHSQNVISNQDILQRLITLTLTYLLETLQNKDLLQISLQANPFTISFKDTGSKPIFSPLELDNRFDLMLILKNLNILNGTYQLSLPRNNQRSLIYIFAND